MRRDIIEPQQQFESRTRNVKLANHLGNKKRLWSDQATLLESITNKKQLDIIEIIVSLWMWNEIRSYTWLVKQEA